MVFEHAQKSLISDIFEELKKAKDKGYNFIDKVFGLIKKRKLQILSLTQEEILKTMKIPDSFADGEKDSIVLCRQRKGVFVTNEKKVRNYCQKDKIDYFDLRDILKAIYKLMDYSKEEIDFLIDEIEKKDNIIIKDKKEIFD